MELHPLVMGEWRDDHCLSKRSLLWIHDHADPGDPNPVLTAVAELRAVIPAALSPQVIQSALVAQARLEAVVAESQAEPPGWSAPLAGE